MRPALRRPPGALTVQLRLTIRPAATDTHNRRVRLQSPFVVDDPMRIDFTLKERRALLSWAQGRNTRLEVGMYAAQLSPALAFGFFGLVSGAFPYAAMGFLGTAFFCIYWIWSSFQGGSVSQSIAMKIVSSWLPPDAVDSPTSLGSGSLSTTLLNAPAAESP